MSWFSPEIGEFVETTDPMAFLVQIAPAAALTGGVEQTVEWAVVLVDELEHQLLRVG